MAFTEGFRDPPIFSQVNEVSTFGATKPQKGHAYTPHEADKGRIDFSVSVRTEMSFSGRKHVHGAVAESGSGIASFLHMIETFGDFDGSQC